MGSAETMKRKERREAIRRPAMISEPKPRVFVAPACGSCAGLRPDYSNYSRVYGTVRRDGFIVRYVRCHFCGNSWTVQVKTADGSNASEIQEKIELDQGVNLDE